MKKIIILLIILIIPLLIFNTSLSANSRKRIDGFKTASREFIKNEDGTYTDVYYSKAINYYKNGIYKSIDNSFVETEDGYTNKESNYIIKTPNILNNETNVTLDYYGDDLKLSFNDINDEYDKSVRH